MIHDLIEMLTVGPIETGAISTIPQYYTPKPESPSLDRYFEGVVEVEIECKKQDEDHTLPDKEAYHPAKLA